ncbi:hypothetical protein BMG45_24490 [Salmonella enterica]|nr:hypothetical protein [Salmonella enterica]
MKIIDNDVLFNISGAGSNGGNNGGGHGTITPVPIHLTEALDTDTEDIMVWDMPPVLLLGDSREV